MTIIESWATVKEHATIEWANLSCWEYHNPHIKGKYSCSKLDEAISVLENNVKLK